MIDYNWSEIFEYSDESPSGLFWKVDCYRGNSLNPYLFIHKGDVVGSLNKRGYWTFTTTRFGGTRTFRVHRIICEMNLHSLGKNVVDHEDGDTSNNDLTNLRIVTQRINTQNAKQYSNNTTGVTGVYYAKRYNAKYDLTTEYYSAGWVDSNGKQRSKSYSINKYGRESAFQMAISFRNKMISEMNNSGAVYTTRHGT